MGKTLLNLYIVMSITSSEDNKMNVNINKIVQYIAIAAFVLDIFALFVCAISMMINVQGMNLKVVKMDENDDWNTNIYASDPKEVPNGISMIFNVDNNDDIVLDKVGIFYSDKDFFLIDKNIHKVSIPVSEVNINKEIEFKYNKDDVKSIFPYVEDIHGKTHIVGRIRTSIIGKIIDNFGRDILVFALIFSIPLILLAVLLHRINKNKAPLKNTNSGIQSENDDANKRDNCKGKNKKMIFNIILFLFALVISCLIFFTSFNIITDSMVYGNNVIPKNVYLNGSFTQ